MKWSDEVSLKVTEALAAKVGTPCEACGAGSFAVVPGFFIHILSSDAGQIMLPGQSQLTVVPTVVTSCTNCGLLRQHAVAALGLQELPLAALGLQEFTQEVAQ